MTAATRKQTADVPIQNIMAAGLADPQLILNWQKNPESLRSLGLEPGELDLEALWKFVGLNIKVRYNPVRAILPLTFRLMSAAAMEIEVFSAYALDAVALRKAGKNSTEDKTESLFAFLEEWLDENKIHHVALWDIMRHEKAILDLRRQASQLGTLPERTDLSAETPVVRGLLKLHQMTYSPQDISDILKRHPADFGALTAKDPCIAYWWDGQSPSVEVLALPLAGFYVLSLVDGKTSTAQIGVQLGCGPDGLSWEDFADLVSGLQKMGLIALADVGGS